MRAEAARVHDPLGDALMIEMKELFAKMKVLERGRTARADLQRILVVGNRDTLLGGQHGDVAAGDLMRLTAGPWQDPLIGELGVL